jgi:hypothetical protein
MVTGNRTALIMRIREREFQTSPSISGNADADIQFYKEKPTSYRKIAPALQKYEISAS